MTLAIKHAIINRDVSHLTFPDEMQTIVADENDKPSSSEDRITALTIAPPKEAFAKAVAQEKPLRIVFKDSGFKNDTAKENVKQLLKQLSPDTEMKVL